MKTKVQKWGNSLGVRLPKEIAQKKALKEGAGVTVSLKNDQIVIEPEVNRSLEALLDQITPTNLHSETEWGGVQGKEIW